ncbi:MAG: hypothetical protein LBH70_03395 [Spirochaetaceae bacterium]|nr:hypothetical protein [Spirochaetaceae bacterium]
MPPREARYGLDAAFGKDAPQENRRFVVWGETGHENSAKPEEEDKRLGIRYD